MTAALVFAAIYLAIGTAFTAFCAWLDRSGGNPVLLPTSLHYSALIVLSPLAFLLLAAMAVCMPLAWLIQLGTKIFTPKSEANKLDDLVQSALEELEDEVPRYGPN